MQAGSNKENVLPANLLAGKRSYHDFASINNRGYQTINHQPLKRVRKQSPQRTPLAPIQRVENIRLPLPDLKCNEVFSEIEPTTSSESPSTPSVSADFWAFFESPSLTTSILDSDPLNQNDDSFDLDKLLCQDPDSDPSANHQNDSISAEVQQDGMTSSTDGTASDNDVFYYQPDLIKYSPPKYTTTTVNTTTHIQQRDYKRTYTPQRPIMSLDFMAIRITWMTNVCKTGWSNIRPFPGAISKKKKLVLEVVKAAHDNQVVKLFIEITARPHFPTNVVSEPQLSVELPDGSTTQTLDISLSSPIGTTSFVGHEIVLDCDYVRPEQKAQRLLHNFKISDERGRPVVDWNLEIYNPKWEAMTSSFQKPELEDVYTLAIFSNDKWRTETHNFLQQPL